MSTRTCCYIVASYKLAMAAAAQRPAATAQITNIFGKENCARQHVFKHAPWLSSPECRRGCDYGCDRSHAHEPGHPLLRSLELAPLAPPNSSNAWNHLACLLARAARLPPRRSAARDNHRDAPSPPQHTTATPTATYTACVGHVGTPASRRDV